MTRLPYAASSPKSYMKLLHQPVQIRYVSPFKSSGNNTTRLKKKCLEWTLVVLTIAFTLTNVADGNETTTSLALVNETEYDETANMTDEEYTEMLENYITPQKSEWVFIFLHSVVFVVGLIGNALVCVAVYRNRTMRTVTNYFIVNLAVADFLVILICLPPTVVWDVTETWFMGTLACKIVLYFQVSVFIIPT
ncbi:G protein-coupled receptor, rhodopsin-like,GPCR, rhodopsin-like, 7TM [Cinara cedri]|uniref:G protein-coupled receptor, rhodopsin-like,GPCR, rhodopsin-like, 7TM n=1 Tax=Cinara cedri TaxID=506608 RepID=A0A5E4NEG6_9HEMI|nr:G protein-coupled receptor, rhodopsin-like,GPCR, rhodopsin-like, 7TM [Cinara cedri]